MKEAGEYKGRECLRLCNHTEEKKKKLCLGDYLCRKNEGQFDMIDFPDDEFSVVRLYKHIEEHFFPPVTMDIEVGRFFRRAASRKQMKVCLIVMCYFFTSIYSLFFCFTSRVTKQDILTRLA